MLTGLVENNEYCCILIFAPELNVLYLLLVLPYMTWVW